MSDKPRPRVRIAALRILGGVLVTISLLLSFIAIYARLTAPVRHPQPSGSITFPLIVLGLIAVGGLLVLMNPREPG